MRQRPNREVEDLKRSLKFMATLQALTLGLLIRNGSLSSEELALELEEAIAKSPPDEAMLLAALQSQLSPLN